MQDAKLNRISGRYWGTIMRSVLTVRRRAKEVVTVVYVAGAIKIGPHSPTALAVPKLQVS